MDDVLKVEDRYYILATSSRADDRTLVLKHGDTFAVFDHYGDIVPFGLGEQGIYHDGTRHLSRLEARLGRTRPLLLSSTVRLENELLTVDLTNPDILMGGHMALARDTLHLFRQKFLWQAACHERWCVTNHGLAPVSFEIELMFGADFADIFEVRGTRRERRGTHLPPRLGVQSIVLGYRGLDQVERRTHLAFSRPPAAVTETAARFDLRLEPQETVELVLTIGCDTDADPAAFDTHREQAAAALAAAKRRRCALRTSNAQVNDWLNQSNADLHMMVTDTPEGLYPYAGVPWFSTPFGRDGIITALEVLWAYPDLARGVLTYLAATQAEAPDAGNDAEPGKILHEARRGEMAALGEIPFRRYYGTADATPLFVLLAGAYHERTGDRAFAEQLWPNVERALEWIDRYGDADGDGFVEYERRSANGLVQQGWKDSNDSVFHSDGRLVEPPVALCEVQAYVYGALRRAAELAEALECPGRAAELAERADRLQARFDEAFWCDELGTFALALDGRKQQCRVRTSNAGQCLFTGIVRPERAGRVAAGLFDERMFSGWGIRTLAASEPRYNPMSYHNGSVWPHDNALIAAGLARYGMTGDAARLLAGFFDVSLFVDLRRMPELFCGFPRRAGEGPTRYPVACNPQSWAAGAAFLMLQACLGLTIDAHARRVTFSRAILPPLLDELRLANLEVGDTTIDLLIERNPHDVGVSATRPVEGVEIVVVK